jgi:hypothetical protein
LIFIIVKLFEFFLLAVCVSNYKKGGTMKTHWAIFLILLAFSSKAQLKQARMEPIYSAGYYVNFKGDTVRGSIQSNPPFETEFYKQFYFSPKKKAKAKLMDTQKVKAYGFANRHFVRIENSGRKEFAERLVSGRLRFFESRYPKDMDNPSNVESEFFVKDTGADEQNAELREFRKINPRSYKKILKPYMKDQLMIWTDLDKFNFDKEAIIKALREFNEFYASL